MNEIAENATSTWEALKRRRLVQWTVAYVAAAWVLLQAASLFAGVYDWPAPTLRILTGILLVGFPVAVVLAWYHGERGQQRINGAELLILSLLLAIGGGVLWFAERERGKEGTRSATTAGDAATNRDDPVPSVTSSLNRKSIAVTSVPAGTRSTFPTAWPRKSSTRWPR